MAFFRNSAVNLLNLHYGIHSIALYGGAAFFSIYLLKVGIPVSGVLVSLALILLGRFVIRPVVIGISARWGLRAMVVGGTVLNALQYPFLAEIHGVGLMLAALIAVLPDELTLTTLPLGSKAKLSGAVIVEPEVVHVDESSSATNASLYAEFTYSGYSSERKRKLRLRQSAPAGTFTLILSTETS